MGGQLAARERFRGGDAAVEGKVRLHPLDDESVQRGTELPDGGVAGLRVDDELREQRIVERRDGVARAVSGVDAHAVVELSVGNDWRLEARNLAGRREELHRILGVDPALDRVTAPLHVGLAEREVLSGRDAKLQLDEIESRHRLGHWMLDLQPGVELDEVHLVVIEEEFAGARIGVPDRASGGEPRREEPLLELGTPRENERRRRSFFDDLLVTALDGALASAEMEREPAVAEDLHLDVTRSGKVALEVDGVLAERGAGTIAAGAQGFDELRRVVRHRHPDPAASGGRLDEDGKADHLRLR